MQKINTIIIGHGYWGKILYTKIQLLNYFRVVGICDTSSLNIKNSKLLKDVNFPVRNNYRDFLNDKNIDAVIVATPAETHFQIVYEFLSAGKNVLVEKPICLTAKEAGILNELATKKGLTLMVDHTFIYAPEIRSAKKIISLNLLGKIKFLDLTREGPNQYKTNTDVIWDFAPHDVSILLYLIGFPVETRLSQFQILDKNRTDISNIYLKFRNNIYARINISWLKTNKTRSIVVIGSKKTMVIEQSKSKSKISIYPNSYYYRNPGSLNGGIEKVVNLKKFNNLPYSEPLKNVFYEFYTSISIKHRPLSDGDFGKKVVDIIEKIEIKA